MNAAQKSRPASKGAEAANVILGIWVSLSPFVLGFSHNSAGKWSNVAVGIGLVLVAMAGTWGNEAFEGLVVPLGVWLFLSPFVLGFSHGVFVANNVSMAIVVIAAGAISDAVRSPSLPTQRPG